MPRAKGMPSNKVAEHLEEMGTSRRIRMRAKTKDQVQKEAKYDVVALSEKVAEARKAFQQAETELQLAESNLFEGMKATKTWEVRPEFVDEDGHEIAAVFTVETPIGRSSTIIDPQKYYGLVDKGLITEQNFFSSISVGVTNARKYLGEKQIERIAETKQPEKKDPVLSTKYVLVDGTPIFGKLPKK